MSGVFVSSGLMHCKGCTVCFLACCLDLGKLVLTRVSSSHSLGVCEAGKSCVASLYQLHMRCEETPPTLPTACLRGLMFNRSLVHSGVFFRQSVGFLSKMFQTCSKTGRTALLWGEGWPPKGHPLFIHLAFTILSFHLRGSHKDDGLHEEPDSARRCAAS